MQLLVFGLLVLTPAVFCGDASAQTSIQDIIKTTQENFQQTLDKLKTDMGLSKNPNGDEIVKAIKTRNEKIAADMQKLRKEVEEKIKSNPDATAVLNSINKKMEEAVAKLKKDNPDIAKNAEKLGEVLKSSWDSVAQEVEKGYKEFSKKGGKQDEVENFFKNIIDQGAKAAKDFQENVNTLLEKKN